MQTQVKWARAAIAKATGGQAMTPTETATILRQFNAEITGG